MVYVDLVMVLNFAVDFLLLLGANRLAGFPPGCKRAALSAMLGGVYGGVCLLPGFSFLGSSFWRVVFLAIMSGIAFGLDRSGLRRGILFILLSMALGGIALGLGNRGVTGLIAAAMGLCLLCAIGFRTGAMRQKYSTVQISRQGRTREMTALQDTGNTLRDPVTGQPVLVVGADVAWDLLGLTVRQLESPIETMVQMPGLRLIPYRSVGQPGGMLLAMKMDQVCIDGKPWDCLVAFAPQNFGSNGYEALAGGMI